MNKEEDEQGSLGRNGCEKRTVESVDQLGFRCTFVYGEKEQAHTRWERLDYRHNTLNEEWARAVREATGKSGSDFVTDSMGRPLAWLNASGEEVR